MSLALLQQVFEACDIQRWNDRNDRIELSVKSGPVPFATLRSLEAFSIFAESLRHSTIRNLQSDYDSNKPGDLPAGATFHLRLPRVVSNCVVAKNLADLLSVSSATYREPKSYFLVAVENSGRPFCFTGPDSLAGAPTLIKRYHDAIKLWEVVKQEAEHSTNTNSLLFFGIRRTEIVPRFTVEALQDEISLSDIVNFLSDPDQQKPRKEIFHSVLSELLRDQTPDRAFSYLLGTSALFARRLKEGLAIYLSAHSAEKLSEEAQAKHLELAEKLEKIITGIEVKSLTIPAAVLLAIKEIKFGEGWTPLNTVIVISTLLYLVTMSIAHFSQRALLDLLKTTILKTTKDLKDQGLDEKNPVLAESFAKLESRRGHSKIGSWVMFAFSFVPLAAVVYAAFVAPKSVIPEKSPDTSVTNRIAQNPPVVRNAESPAIAKSNSLLVTSPALLPTEILTNTSSVNTNHETAR